MTTLDDAFELLDSMIDAYDMNGSFEAGNNIVRVKSAMKAALLRKAPTAQVKLSNREALQVLEKDRDWYTSHGEKAAGDLIERARAIFADALSETI